VAQALRVHGASITGGGVQGRPALDALEACIVSRPFPSWNRSILTEIYLCHACYCQEILRTETAGQAAAEASLGSFKGEQRRK
jgi:hypothetical protein